MNTGTCACGCGASLADLRADAVWASEACKKRAERARSRDKAGTSHPLQAVREDQAAKKHNRDLGGLIRQAIIDRIKATGECFADDLIGLYPANEVKECRRLATAQFGSLTARGLIREKERRKSSIPERKGAKSGVYDFTKAGWDRWGTAGVEGERSREWDVPGAGLGHSLDSGDSGVTGPGSGVGAPSSQERAGSPVGPPCTDTASPENVQGGSRGSLHPGENKALSLLPEPDPESWAA